MLHRIGLPFMKSLDEYLRDAEQAHGHLCAGQVLGVRMAMLGLEKLLPIKRNRSSLTLPF